MSPGFTLDITVMQIGEDLMIEWTAPSVSSLTYEVHKFSCIYFMAIVYMLYCY